MWKLPKTKALLAMNNVAQKKPDYVFIASLIAIIVVAVYLAMERFKGSNISEYLHETGQNLLAQIDDLNERKNLETDYNEFIEKVNEREIDPEKVEHFVSSMINLNQEKKNINKDEFIYIFETTLKEASKPDSIKKHYKENNEKWTLLQKRLKDINKFEETIRKVVIEPEAKNSYSFSYTVDDTLNIIINEEIKKNIENVKHVELAKELKRFEAEKILKWHNEADFMAEKHKALKETLLRIKEVEAALPVLEIPVDSLENAITPVESALEVIKTEEKN